MDRVKFEVTSLEAHPMLDRAWVIGQIANDPSMLHMGKLSVGPHQPNKDLAGGCDLVLLDKDRFRSYEVVVKLGQMAEREIFRALEAWDAERKRNPNYSHVGVIIAEEMAGRFVNDVNLIAGSVPLIVLKMSAIKVGVEVGLLFTTVYDGLSAITNVPGSDALPEGPDTAEDFFSQALDDNPDNFTARYYAGVAREHEGDHLGAAKIWGKMLAEAPSDAPWRSRVENDIRRAASEGGFDLAALLVEMGVGTPTRTSPDSAVRMMPKEGAEKTQTAQTSLRPGERLRLRPDQFTNQTERPQTPPERPAEQPPKVHRDRPEPYTTESERRAGTPSQGGRQPEQPTAPPRETGRPSHPQRAAPESPQSKVDRQPEQPTAPSRETGRASQPPRAAPESPQPKADRQTEKPAAEAPGTQKPKPEETEISPEARESLKDWMDEASQEAGPRQKPTSGQKQPATPVGRPPIPEDQADDPERDPEEAERMARLRGMVTQLAAKLRENPDDRDGWLRLCKSYQILGEMDKAKAAFAKAEALRQNK